jgi:putative Mg2+ transporter-C (MgtC) family protein
MEQWLSTLDWQWQALIRLVVACVLGALVGIERQHHGREAGFRTQLLVALGAALTMVVSINFERYYGRPGVSEVIRLDPARIAYGVMVGIGFLGAGAIIRRGSVINGLTTAASLWCTAAVGLACGFGMFWIALFATILVLAALVMLGAVEGRVGARWHKIAIVAIKPRPGVNSVTMLGQALASHGVKISDVGYMRDNETDLEIVTLQISVAASRKFDEMVDWLRDVPEVKKLTVQ